MTAFNQEIDALQRVIWQVAGLKSMRLMETPPQIARPVILWEAPSRSRSGHIGRYAYTNKVAQYGKLYAHSLDALLTLQSKIEEGLESLDGVIPVFDKEGPQGVVVGHLRNPEIEFANAENLDVPVIIRYSRNLERLNKPKPAPAAAAVHQRKAD